MTDPRLIDLLLRYEELREQGHTIPLDNLCQECPELLSEMKKRVKMLTVFTPLPISAKDESITSRPRPGQSATPPAIPGYEILGVLGEGGMGIIYRARHLALNRVVALKIILAQNAAPDDHARFQREAEITARLEHPGIVPVYSLLKDAGDRPCYAMRLIGGESLQEAIRRFHEAGQLNPNRAARRLEVRQLLGHFLDVCNTISYAHSRGVIHRDIKPANIMLGKYGEVMVVDWGLGKTVGRGPAERTPNEKTLRLSVNQRGPEATTPGEMMGTPAFMSPEQAFGQEVTPVSDVFSLGATLYYILAGQAPFRGVDSAEVLRKVQDGVFPPPSKVKTGVSAALESICLKAMARNSEDRYPTVRALAEDVEKWLADEAVSTLPESAMQRLQRWSRRRRTFVTSLVISSFLVLLSLAAGIYLWHLGEQGRLEADYKAKQFEMTVGQQNLARFRDLEALTAAELHAGNFAIAYKILQPAVAELESDPAHSDLRRRWAARRDRVGRLVDFYQYSNEAENAVAENYLRYHKGALSNLMKAAEALRVYEHPEWWKHLPDEDLLPAQREQLKRDACREITLLAALQTQQAYVKLGNPEATAAFRAAQRTIAALDRCEPTLSAQILSVVCHSCLSELDQLKPNSLRTPTNSADHRYIGMIYAFAAINPDDFRTKVFRSLAAPLLGLEIPGGEASQAIAERYMITAANMEPLDYWTNYWHGTALLMGKKPDSAEVVYNFCVGLRPKYKVAYGSRAIAIQNQILNTNDPIKKKFLTERAFAGLNEGIRANPHAGWPFVYRGVAHNIINEPNKAIADFNKAIELDPNDDLAFFERGRTYLKRGLFVPAIADFTASLKILPEDEDVLVARGEANMNAGDYDRAIQDFNDASRLSPSLISAHNLRGHVYFRQKNYEQARDEYTRALKIMKVPVVFFNRANCFFNLNKYDKALLDANEALKLANLYVDAYVVRGRCYLATKKIDLALADFEHALKLHPGYWPAYAYRGDCWRMRGEFDRAAQDYHQAVSNQVTEDVLPGLDEIILKGAALPSVYFTRGLARFAQKQYDEACADLEYAYNKELATARLRYLLPRGRAYMLAGRFDKAEADFSQAVRANSQDIDALFERGSARAALKRYIEADADMREVLQSGADPVIVGHRLALVSLAQKDLAGFHKHCATMVEHCAKTQVPELALLVVRTCSLTSESKIPAETINQLAELGHAREPRNPISLMTLGAAYLRAGKLVPANQCLVEAWQRASPIEKIPIHLYRAQYCLQVGRKDEALIELAHADRLEKASGFARTWGMQLESALLREEIERLRKN